MSVLTREILERELAAGKLVIEPLDPSQVGPASVDLTLGDEIRVMAPAGDEIVIREETDYQSHTRARGIGPDGYVLAPGETIHGITRERIGLPSNLCGFLEGRSRFARLGLMIHVTSAFVQPGVASHQVLEMSNLAGHPLRLVPGVRLCQLVLMRTEGEALYRGRFWDQERP